MTVMAASTVQPCRVSLTINPNVWQSAAEITRMARTSRKFASAVGFSKGCAELTLKKPPPLVPSCLMAIWEAAGPTAMTCSVSVDFFIFGWPVASSTGLPAVSVSGSSYSVGWTPPGGDRGPEGLDHPLGHQHHRQHEGQRQQM